MQRLGVRADNLGDDLAFGAARQIGAGQRRGGVEKLRPARRFIHAHGADVPPDMFQRPGGSVNVRMALTRTTTSLLTRSCKVRWWRVKSAINSSRPVVARVR